MGSHRRARRRLGRNRRATLLAGAMVLAGAVVLVLAVVRADLTPPRLAAGPAPASPAAPAPTASTPAGPFAGTWVGPLDDPDTATVEVRLTVGGLTLGTVVEVPALGCTYRGPVPEPVPDDPRRATTDLRSATDGGPGCVDTARIGLGAVGSVGSATERVRYELLDSCDGAVCAPRRASGVLTAVRPGS